MGQSINCSSGGYDHKFNHGENTKHNLEFRTNFKNWGPDLSLYSSNLNQRISHNPENPLLQELARQEAAAKEIRKNFKRSVPRETFADNLCYWEQL